MMEFLDFYTYLNTKLKVENYSDIFYIVNISRDVPLSLITKLGPKLLSKQVQFSFISEKSRCTSDHSD